MKRFTYTILCALLITAVACEKVSTSDYLAPLITWSGNPFTFNKGIYTRSSNPNLYNSSLPIKASVIDVREAATGKSVKELFLSPKEKYIWLAAMNSLDTTLELLNKKRRLARLPVLELDAAGAVIMHETSTGIPSGEYIADIRVENGGGSREHKNAFRFTMQDAKPFAVTAVKSGTPRYESYLEQTYFNPAHDVTYTITREDAPQDELTVKVKDKNGVFFSPKDFVKNPMFNDYGFHTPIKPVVTDTSITYAVISRPFPFISNKLVCMMLPADRSSTGLRINLFIDMAIQLPGKYTIDVKYTSLVKK